VGKILRRINSGVGLFLRCILQGMGKTRAKNCDGGFAEFRSYRIDGLRHRCIRQLK
jgi:hypothetical protein